jgi:hypothetical protein
VVDVYLSFYLCNFLWFLTNWVLLQRERGCFSPTISSPLYIMIRCRLSNIVTIERKHSTRWSCNNYQRYNDNKFIIQLPWWINRPTLFPNIHYTGGCNLGRFSNTPTLPAGPAKWLQLWLGVWATIPCNLWSLLYFCVILESRPPICCRLSHLITFLVLNFFDSVIFPYVFFYLPKRI